MRANGLAFDGTLAKKNCDKLKDTESDSIVIPIGQRALPAIPCIIAQVSVAVFVCVCSAIFADDSLCAHFSYMHFAHIIEMENGNYSFHLNLIATVKCMQL